MEKTYSTYESDDLFTLQLQARVQYADLYTTGRFLTLLCLVCLKLAKLAQANCGKDFGKRANTGTCGSSKFTLMFHSPTIRGVLRIVLH